MKRLMSALVRYVPRKYLQRISAPGLKLAGFFLRGNKVVCPICQRQFRKFLPYGRFNARPNALCPNCLSLERHRLIWLFLERETPFFATKQSVLHIAPEACFIHRFEKIHGDQYITADLESPLAKVKMDIHQMPFATDTFDVVLCNHVLEHVNDDIQALREIARVLKPGGFSILQVPFFNPVQETTFSDPTITDRKMRERMFGQDDHVRRYGTDYPQRIASAGLEAAGNTFANTLTPEERQRFGVVKGEVIFTGTKK